MTDPQNYDWRAEAAALARQLETDIDDAMKPGAGDAARLIVDGIRKIIHPDDPELTAMKFAMTIARMVAVFGLEPVQDLSETTHNTMVAYAFAAGILSGGYEAPACEECKHGRIEDIVIPDTVPEDWGNYL